jgi:membrane protein
MDLVASLRSSLHRLFTRPVAELSRAQRLLRFALDLTRHCGRELDQDNAQQLAAALTYRTIFSLVPLLMVSMLAFRLFGDMDAAFMKLQSVAYGFFDFGAGSGQPEAAALKSELDERLRSVVMEVASIRFERLGALGAVLFVWAALGLLMTMEDAANAIYRAPRGRGFLARVVIYWAVLTLGPLVLLAVLYFLDQAYAALAGVPLFGALLLLLASLDKLLASWLLLTLLYKLLPNTRVDLRPALAGALVAGALWEASRWAFGLYVSDALPYLKLYGAIGLIPLFLFWIYLNWLIVLFGMELAFTLQAMRGGDFERLEEQRTYLQSGNPYWLVPLMSAVARAFLSGRSLSRQSLAEELRLPLQAVAELCAKLEDRGYLHSLRKRGSEDMNLVLARPPEQVPISDLLDLAAGLTIGPRARRECGGWEFLGSLTADAAQRAGARSLRDLVSPGGT